MEEVTTLPKTYRFGGDKKELVHFLVPYEKKFIDAALPHVPQQISTAHLTLMTLFWSVGIVMAGYMARADIRWLWLFSICIFLQYITDMLDGAVGRERNTGLIKWGFYMDHFLDYIFLSAIVIGYSFLLPTSYFLWSLFALAFSAGLMVHTIMDFAITNHFKISFSYFGVSEARLILVIFNVILIVFSKWLLVQAFPFFVGALFIALCLTVYRSQRSYAHIDAMQQGVKEQVLPLPQELKSGVFVLAGNIGK
jgi:phosphatidylglycerophosphate synthase